jgi:CheY-like chemotaxis protein
MSVLTLSPAICLVDDNPDDLFFTRRLLERAGVRDPLLTFSSGRDALTYLLDVAARHHEPGWHLPRAIILDGNMPGLDGFDVLCTVRSLPLFNRVKIVMLSGSRKPDDPRRASDLGADAYLAKFPAADELARAISNRRTPAK